MRTIECYELNFLHMSQDADGISVAILNPLVAVVGGERWLSCLPFQQYFPGHCLLSAVIMETPEYVEAVMTGFITAS